MDEIEVFPKGSLRVAREIRDGHPCVVVEAVAFDRKWAQHVVETATDWAHTLPVHPPVIRAVEVSA